MEYRLNKKTLLDVLSQWNTFLRRKIHLIACGGTALTLLDVKESTKDVDFMVPNIQEYGYLIKVLKDLGYQQISGAGWQRKGEMFLFDIFPGKRIHTTELLESPLENGNHTKLKEFSHIYVGILNDYDLIASKLFRGSRVDFEDCLMLVKERKDKIDIKRIESHFKKLALYDISEERIVKHIEHFIDLLREEGIYA